MNRKDVKSERYWCLQLANDRNWTFAAVAPLSAWLDTFAKTMKLRQANPTRKGPRLVFRRKRDMPALCGTNEEMGDITLLRESTTPNWSCTLNRRRGRKRDIDFMRHSLMAVYMDAVDEGGFPCHAGLLTWDGHGVIIAGVSGTGKSTICRRLSSTGAVLCDEETLVVRDSHGGYWGHPFPTWSRLFESPGSQSWEVEKAVPLEGIIFVFPAGEDQCKPVRPGEAAAKLTRMAMDKSMRGLVCLNEKTFSEMKKKIFANVCLFVSKIPAACLNISLASDVKQEFEKACQCLWQNTQ